MKFLHTEFSITVKRVISVLGGSINLELKKQS